MKKFLTGIVAAGAFLAVSGAEFVIEDFRNFNVADWSPGRGAKLEKGSVGAKITIPGWLNWKKRLNTDWRKRTDWNQTYNGLAFKVKGDGSSDYANIGVILDYSLTFRWYFPLKNTEWTEYRVHFDDFTAAGCTSLKISTAPGNLPTSSICGINFGDRWTIGHNNAVRKSASFEVADVRLISDARVRFEVNKYKPAPFAQFRKKLKNGEKLDILCLGDSITAGSSLHPADNVRYADVTGKILREKYGCKNVTSRSLAVGGANSWDVCSWLDRDFEKVPDLVTFMAGYNDLTQGMHPAVYSDIIELWLQRVGALSKGKCTVVLFTPIPGCGPRYHAHDRYAEAIRKLAEKHNLRCFDLNRIFKEKYTPETIGGAFNDQAHPNAAGHRFIAEKFAEFLNQ